MPDAPRRLTHGWTAPDGSRWRVGDIAFGPPLAAPYKWVPLELGDVRATDRVFAGAADGLLRIATLAPGDHGALGNADLVAQLRRAEVWETRPIDELIPGYAPERKPPPEFGEDVRRV